MELLLQPEILVSLLTLTVMEIVLGIDNVVFISLVVGRLPVEQREKARQIGLFLALLLRVLLLTMISWIAKMETPLINIGEVHLSGRDLVLLGGGLFLLYKSTAEIHHKMEGASEEHSEQSKATISFSGIIGQIVILDLVFSIDSVITAIGLAQNVIIMIIAVVLSMAVMLKFSKYIAEFIERHPTTKMLALSFLLMIGLLLVAESFHVHVPKGYAYFAMAFSTGVEMLNLRTKKKK